ncbi:MAG: STN domain-containing protein [Cyclobacteriaceae bacterium]
MKLAKIIGMVWVCMAFAMPPQDNLLNKTVSLQYQKSSIESILQDIRQSYGIRFSYLNNEIPPDIRISLQMKDQPLSAALDEILKETHLTYQVVNGQIILRKDLSKPRQAEVRQSGRETKAEPVPQAPTSQKAATAEEGSDTLPQEVQTEESDSTAQTQEKQAEEAVQELQLLALQQTESISPSADLPSNEPAPTRQNVRPYIPTKPAGSKASKRKIHPIGQGFRKLLDGLPGDDDGNYETRPFHLGFIYPLSTNGVDAGEYVNEISLHAFAGYSAGVDGFEASGFGNLTGDFVDGVQLAGFFNIVRNDVKGLQSAGFLNVNGGELKGAQLSGFMNTSAGGTKGVQSAGFLNISGAYTQGAQLAGFLNLAAHDAEAIQAAGFANINNGSLTGVQLAGFMNIARGDMQGMQASGFLNVAGNMQGVQLGVLNIADSASGVPIGLLSIVRKNGYRRLEVWGGETLHANVAFKTGVQKFYNIFAFGSQFADENLAWGFGYGMGSEFPIASRSRLNLDLIGYTIHEDNRRPFEDATLNLLTTLRLGYALQLSKYFSLFAAPTFNVMVSQLQNAETTQIGSQIAPYTIFDRTYDNKTNLQMWPGLQLGVRF